MKVLGLIPARGGSKGLPGKNIKPLGGIPLLGHTIRTAKQAPGIDRLWVSTDDPAIAAVAEEFGVPVPWLRPPELAQDASSLVDALIHLLERLGRDEGYRPDAILVLQVTSPFRKAATIVKALELFARSGGSTILSVTPAHSHPFWSYRIDPERGVLVPFIDGIVTPPPRQKLPDAYVLDGSICVIATDSFLKNRSFFSGRDLPVVVPHDEAIDIDTPLDWALAEAAWRMNEEARS